MDQVQIPKLEKFECPRCNRQAVAETGTVMLCQPCVNEFLAKNVGTMQPLVEVIPLDEPPIGSIERAALKDGVHSDGTG